MAPHPPLSSRHHAVPIPLPERPRSSPSRPRTKRRRRRRSLTILSTLIGTIAGGGVLLARFAGEDDEEDSKETHRVSRRVDATTDGRRVGIRPDSLESVVGFLTGLAERRPAELWNVFGAGGEGYGDDLFSLSLLETGQCPWSTSSSSSTVEWLPPLPRHSVALSADFRSNNRPAVRGSRRNKNVLSDNTPRVVLWYEHISKAGGTTFCALAQSNMPAASVPRYHCMPRKGELMDGRVGSWTNEELVDVVTHQQPYRIVANEWDPFDGDKLHLSGRDLWTEDYGREQDNGNNDNNNNNNNSPRLLFVTTLRDPADRLLSSYTFFSDYSEQQQRDVSNFGVWIRKNLARVGNFKAGGRSAFRSNIARNNYMVWRFSGGTLPDHQVDEEENASFFVTSRIFPSAATEKSAWKRPFQAAVRALANFDLVLPMDVMTRESGKQVLRELLGWDQFVLNGRRYVGEKESGHVVTTGEVRNSNARAYLEERGSGEEFRALWERNWLDYILFYWARAVFFARLYCREILAE